MLDKHLAKGHVAYPFSERPYADARVAPFGTVAKSHAGVPAGYRVVSDESYGDGVNAGIEKVQCGWDSHDEVAEAIANAGPGCRLIKLDVEGAFNLMSVREADIALLAFRWKGLWGYWRVLNFGLRTSPPLFDRLARALRWVLRARLKGLVVLYWVDDFLCVVPVGFLSGHVLPVVHSTCEELGIPLKHAKTEGPTTSLTYCGIGHDTVSMVRYVDPTRVTNLLTDLTAILESNSTTPGTVASLAGKLAYVARIVRPGRAFVRRMFTFANMAPRRSQRCPLTPELRADLRWWLTFLPRFPGRAIMRMEHRSQFQLCFFTDASARGQGGAH